MSITRKQILFNKVVEIQKTINDLNIKQSFFSLDDYDLTDIMMLFDIKFKNSSNYLETLKELNNYSSQKLTDEEIIIIYPIVEEFIIWYYNIFKNL
jgi:hypothetical protein